MLIYPYISRIKGFFFQVNLLGFRFLSLWSFDYFGFCLIALELFTMDDVYGARKYVVNLCIIIDLNSVKVQSSMTSNKMYDIVSMPKILNDKSNLQKLKSLSDSFNKRKLNAGNSLKAVSKAK